MPDVAHDADNGEPRRVLKRIRRPEGSCPGHSRAAARVSFTTVTAGIVSIVSVRENSRPWRTGIPIVLKYSGLTMFDLGNRKLVHRSLGGALGAERTLPGPDSRHRGPSGRGPRPEPPAPSATRSRAASKKPAICAARCTSSPVAGTGGSEDGRSGNPGSPGSGRCALRSSRPAPTSKARGKGQARPRRATRGYGAEPSLRRRFASDAVYGLGQGACVRRIAGTRLTRRPASSETMRQKPSTAASMPTLGETPVGNGRTETSHARPA